MDEARARGMSRELEQQGQILPEMQLSNACAFLFTLEKLTYQDSRQHSAQISNQYFDWSSMRQTLSATNISQRWK